MIKRLQKLKNKKGFTLVELMVVVAIIGVLTAIAVPMYNSVTDNANKKAVEANLRTIDSAIMQYLATGKTETPSSTNLVGVDGFLQTWPTGPSGVTEYGITSTTPFKATVKFDNAKAYKVEGIVAATEYTLEELKDGTTVSGW